MKRKVIGFIVCFLLICFSALSKANINLDNMEAKETFNNINNLNEPNIDGSFDIDFWIEQDKLNSSDGVTGDYFGSSVAIDSNYAIVGVYNDDGGMGSAYVFIRNDNSWVEDQKLAASDGETGDYFGISVSIDGNYVVVGACGDNGGIGSAYVFNHTGTGWIEEYKLAASDGVTGDYFGCSVSISGNYAIVGAYGDDDNTGSVYVYNNSVMTWVEEIKLVAPDCEVGDCFGSSVANDGSYVIIGAFGDDNNSGSAYVLEHCCYWAWRSKVNSSSSPPYFGWSVSINSNFAIVGAPGEPASSSQGSAYIYNRDGHRWYEQTNWSGENYGDYFGISVAIDGNYAVVGAYGDNSSTGSAYLFNRTNMSWSEEQKIISSDGETGDYFGCSVSIYAGYVLIGAYGDNNSSGSAYVFLNSGIPDLFIKISGGFGVKTKIINNGDNDVKNLDFTIYIKGGIFGMINRSFHYKIDILAGKSKTVSTGLFFGIGIIDLLASTDFEEKSLVGIQLLFFSIVY